MANKKIQLICERCGSVFLRAEKQVKNNLSRGRQNYCSLSCNSKKYPIRALCMQCEFCNIFFTKESSQVNKTSNHFCSRSCAAKWKNMHKKVGFRRSKLESYLVSKFEKEHPYIRICPNERTLIGLELDLFLPDYNIAFEINGICHYKPIYGDYKFKKTLQNDTEKQQKCKEAGIKLIIISNLWRKFTADVGDDCWSKYIAPCLNLSSNN